MTPAWEMDWDFWSAGAVPAHRNPDAIREPARDVQCGPRGLDGAMP